ncbi:MAG TPA: bifunctional glutamate N-acetyltransferase/amino-acid acetyltransferase ArgJ, partial [Caulobacteraceae bacterium]|nr:bifunctional glutamate N-acetyltransferase/amino-acid acetyltransferase ArgJ [Caulobacteraceae bacterium]
MLISPLAVPFPDMPAVAGVELAVGRAGLYPGDRDDVLLMRLAEGTTCAGLFTRHAVGSAPVDWCRAALKVSKGRGVRGLVANAGCANAFTGKAGARAAGRVAAAAAKALGAQRREIMLASTGVIGVLLDDGKVNGALATAAATLAPGAWLKAARAIATTDTFPKGAFAEASIDGSAVRIAGIAKGSGMIAPDLATMLAFVVTDAAIEPRALQALVDLHARATLGAVTVDGDRSTNDTLLVFATGRCNAPLIARPADTRLADFSAALKGVLLNLAQQLVRDGEGASKFVAITVTGAKSDASARKIARTVAESPLVKTAFAGEDANWGRIVMAVGRADEPIKRERLSVKFGELFAARDGVVARDYREEAMSAYMKNAELEVAIDVGVGRGRAVMWTCDLTKRYVEINGDYRS